MIVFEGLDTVRKPFDKSTVAIGAFDGIHAGHQAIIRTAVSDARAHNRPAIVFTFDRHPAEVLRPDRAPEYLTTPAQRVRYILQLEVDVLVVARFDLALAHQTPGQFVQHILKDLLGAQAVVVGSDFRFGQDRAGDVPYLQSVSEEMGFAVTALDPVVVGERPASSTRIRELLQSGDIREAEEALGHPYLLAGHIVKGMQLGRELGFPTANLERSWRQVVPKAGIYAVRALIDDGREIDGACSIGTRPTIDPAGALTIETYLLDFDEDIYGREMEIRFLQYLRPEAKFDSLDALKAQMTADVKQVRIIAQRRGGAE
jgi:riboflavin kinase/FMN adenylyltransferase